MIEITDLANLSVSTGILKTASVVAVGSFTSLFPIVNPIGNIPAFLVLTDQLESHERARIALKITVNVFVLLILFFLVGSLVLQYFSISLDVIRVAGGLVICQSGWSMMFADPVSSPDTESESDVTFFPLSTPIFAGPGALAVAIGLSSKYSEASFSWLHQGGAIIGILGVAILTYICLRASSSVLELVGKKGTQTFSKLFGFVILALGTQLIALGLEGWLGAMGFLAGAVA